MTELYVTFFVLMEYNIMIYNTHTHTHDHTQYIDTVYIYIGAALLAMVDLKITTKVKFRANFIFWFAIY